MKQLLRLAVAVCLLFATLDYSTSTALAQGTAFSYQGHLSASGLPANGNYDFRFRLAIDPLANNYAGSAYFTNAVPVTNGLFSTTIDFDGGIFTGSNYWLEVDVRTNGNGGYTDLSPLQSVTPTPYAVFANTASNLSGTVSSAQLTGVIPTSQLNGTIPISNVTGTVPLTQLPMVVVTNGEMGVTLSGGFTGTLAGNATTATTASITTNVVSGIAITNAYITNSVFAGDGGGLTNLNASQLASIGNKNFFVGPAGNATTTGVGNTAEGYQAFLNNTSGSHDTAIGLYALYSNTSGYYNTALGLSTLYYNTNGVQNTAVGTGALSDNTSGSNNIAMGYLAGINNTTGSSNIDIGNFGASADNNIIRIGTPGIQTNTIIAGTIYGDGGGLTNLNAAQLSGAIPGGVFMPATNLTGLIQATQLPAVVITNDEPSVTIGGTNAVAPLTVPPAISPTAVGTVSVSSSPSVVVAGRYAYVVNGNGLQIFDVSLVSTPVNVGTAATGNSLCLAVAGSYAYVGGSSDNLYVVDVSDQATPVVVSTVSLSGSPQNIVAAGHYVYVLSGGALQIFDVSNPWAPGNVGNDTGLSGIPFGMTVAGRYAYVVSSGNSTLLQVVDVSNPSNPSPVGSLPLDFPKYVTVAGNYAYVTADDGLHVIDVSNPAGPINDGSVTLGGLAQCPVVVAGRYAYVANKNTSSVQVFDVSNPSAPVNVGSLGTSGNDIAVSGRYAYVVNGSALQVFDMGGAYIQQFEAGAMETGTLQTRDTVTVGNNLDVRGGMTVSASARISGGLSVDNGTIAATNFSGNGGGLTNLNAAQLTGTLPLAQLPTAVVTNNASSVSLSGTFSGNGSGLTDLNASQLVSMGNFDFFVGSAGNLTDPGEYSTAIGVTALRYATGYYNTAVGYDALNADTTGGNNTAVGANALGKNVTGFFNTAYGSGSLQGNTNGNYNTAIGWQALLNITNSTYNIALGYQAGLNITGSSNIDIGNTGVTGENNIIRIGTSQTATYISGNLYASGAVFSNGVELVSDRNAKEHFTPVSPQTILDKVTDLPITEWNYKTSKESEHIGPMAQDFHAAFGLDGPDDKHISVVDEGGVALAAIQGLNQKLNEKDAEIANLEARLDKLEQLVGEKNKDRQ